MSRTTLKLIAVAAAAALLLGATPALAQKPVLAGETRAYSAATPRPYPVGSEQRPVVWEDVVSSPGATWIRIHFTGFDLAEGDFVTVRSPRGGQIDRYEGRGPYGNGDFWAFSVEGDTAIVKLHGGRNMGAGYTITEVAHGTTPEPQPVAEVVCGTEGRKDVACYTSPAKSLFNPIARLLFASGGAWYVCTGSLVAGQNASTLITNNHCIASQSETNTLEARFNYQKAACKGRTLEPYTNYAGGTFLKTDAGLDYTLLTLQGNPEAAWGEYVATTVEPTPGSVMLFPQHPGGNLKMLGKFEDNKQKILCDVTAVHESYPGSGATAGSQFSYGCDSEGGSSGSPILNGTGTRVWGLHHFGGVNSCNNAATHMSNICGNAGALLSCSGSL